MQLAHVYGLAQHHVAFGLGLLQGRGVELTAHDHFYFEDTGNRLWCSAFSAVWDGPLKLQPEEVLEARFIPIEQVMREIREKPYCPDSLAALKRYLKAQQSNVAKNT